MKILFWTGYRFERWNGKSKEGLGGTETAVLEVAKRLVTYGHEVTIAGEVLTTFVYDGPIDGVTYLDIDDFELRMDVANPDVFDIVIGVNYIHFLQYCKDVMIEPKYKWFWMHNTEFEPWYKGELCDVKSAIDNIQSIITPSEWAGNEIMERIIKPHAEYVGGWKGVVQSIPNGINSEDFKIKASKDPNKFIWSSAVDRGLVHLLDNWYKIKEAMPEATLDIYYPKYSNPHGNQIDGSWYNIDGINDKIESLNSLGVRDMGTVPKQELYAAMARASYWMYLTQYEETFCITALEMQMSNVLCITSDKAALDHVVQSGIKVPTADYETMFDNAVKVLKSLANYPNLKQKAIKDAREIARKQTWDSVAKTWHDIITQNAEEIYNIKYEN